MGGTGAKPWCGPKSRRLRDALWGLKPGDMLHFTKNVDSYFWFKMKLYCFAWQLGIIKTLHFMFKVTDRGSPQVRFQIYVMKLKGEKYAEGTREILSRFGLRTMAPPYYLNYPVSLSGPRKKKFLVGSLERWATEKGIGPFRGAGGWESGEDHFT